MLWSYLLPLLTEERFWHVLTFAAVLLVYSGVHVLKGNELIAVLVFGLTLANFPAVQKRLHLDQAARSDWFSETPLKAATGAPPQRPHAQMLTFHGELAFLLRTFFFVLLGTLVEFEGLRKNIRAGVPLFRRDLRRPLGRDSGRTPRLAHLLPPRARADDLVRPPRPNHA